MAGLGSTQECQTGGYTGFTSVLCAHGKGTNAPFLREKHRTCLVSPGDGCGQWGQGSRVTAHPPTSDTSATVSSTTSVSSGKASCCCWEEKTGFREVRAKASFSSGASPAWNTFESWRAGRAAHGRSPRLCLRDCHRWGDEGQGEAKHRTPWDSRAPPHSCVLYLTRLSFSLERISTALTPRMSENL